MKRFRFSHTTWVLMMQPIKQVIGLFVSIIMARLLIPDDYGLIAAGQFLTGFLWIFSGLGIYEAAVQKSELSQEDAEYLFSVNLLLSLLLFAFSSATAPLLSKFFGSPALLRIVPVLSLTFVFNSLGVIHNAILARAQRFRAMVLLELAGQLIAALVAVAMAWFGYSYWSLVALNVIMLAVPSIGAWFVSGWRPRHVKITGMADMMKTIQFGLSVMVGNLINFLAGQVDKILVGRYYRMHDLGLYSRSQQLATYSSNLFFVGPHRFVTARLARLQNDITSYRDEFLQLLSIASWGSVLVNSLLAINARGVVKILFGIKWDDMYFIFFLICIGNTVFVMAYAYQWLHMSLGNGRQLVWANIIRFALATACAVAGLAWGVTGLAAAYSAYLWIFAVIAARSCAFHTGGKTMIYLLTTLRPVMFATPGIFIALVYFPLTDQSYWTMLFRSTALLVIFIVLSVYFDKANLRNIIKLLVRRDGKMITIHETI